MSSEPAAQPLIAERFPDPHTGLKLLRRCLGRTFKGKLYLHPSKKSTGINLYFRGSLADVDAALDADLQHHILACWRKLSQRHKPDLIITDFEPIKIAVARYWLCRLPGGRYEVEERKSGNGTALYKIEIDDRPWPSEQPEPSDGPIYYPQQLSE